MAAQLAELAYPRQDHFPFYLKERQHQLLLHPEVGLEDDFRRIYLQGDYSIGWPVAARRIFEHLALSHTNAIIGIQVGDEGKGRIVDNLIQELIKNVQMVYIIRFNGGANAGHTVEKDGLKLALHQVPSGVMYGETVGIIDSGTAIHPEDFATEVEYAEKKIGQSLKDRLYLSQDALLITDLERAEETLMKYKRGRKGTTGRGISAAYKNKYTYTPIRIKDLLSDSWEEQLGTYYGQLNNEFSLYPDPETQKPKSLAEITVPDYEKTLLTGKEEIREVGNKQDFLKRLKVTRQWLLDRDIVKDTFIINRQILNDIENLGVIFEGAQGVGLHPWLGTIKDTSSSDTTVSGILAGTSGAWRPDDIANRVGAFKATYMSDVGYREMPTLVDIGDVKSVAELYQLFPNPTPDQIWAAWIREAFGEFGTTTGRPRHISHLDLELLRFNCWVGGIEVLAATHMDSAREDEKIKVCTHYTDGQGNVLPYRPGLEYLKNVVPYYIELDGWDGEKVKDAKSFDDLPENARKYLAFIQARTGIPIVIATTGPKRDNMVEIPSVKNSRVLYLGDENPATFNRLMQQHRDVVTAAQNEK